MTQVVTAPVIPAQLAGDWAIDPAHSEIGFTVRHLMTKVRGHFGEFSGQFTVDADNVLNSTAKAQVQMASVDTRNEMRDGHVRSGEIFDVENHPTMDFVSTAIRPTGEDTFELDGALTVRGVTLPVVLEAEFLGHQLDQFGGDRIGFSATTKISRKAYGMEFNIPLQGDRVLLSDEVNVTLDVQAVRPQ